MTLYYEESGIQIYHGDCREILPSLPRVDCVISDPPYGTTACSWDSVIPFPLMWAELKRIVRADGAIVLFGSQPFTSALVMSNPSMFRYQWVWNKLNGGNPFLVKTRPIIQTEDVLIFGIESPIYLPQIDSGNLKNIVSNGTSRTETNEHFGEYEWDNNRNVGYPRNILTFCDAPRDKVHPTQKPVDLLRYLLRTYSKENESVLDFACGSGTTLRAAKDLGRKAIGIEIEEKYCEIAANRLRQEVLCFD
jgi:hypothetical protein